MIGSMASVGCNGMRELSFVEADMVGAGEAFVDGMGGLIGVGGGMTAIGGGMAMEAGLAAGLVVGGGALCVVGGVALIGYAVYEAFN